MILYSKTAWGLHLLYRLYGSAVLRCTPFTVLSGGLTAILYTLWGDDDRRSWRHPYPYALSAFIVGFVVVFRSNFGYQRYWEGRSHIQEMSGRWADAFTQAIAFYSARRRMEKTEADAFQFQGKMLHLMSLMHGLAVQHLRRDWDLCNLHPFNTKDPPPPVDAAAVQYFWGPPTRPDGTWRFALSDLFMLRGTDRKRRRYNRALPLGIMGGLSSAEAQLLRSNSPGLAADDLSVHNGSSGFSWACSTATFCGPSTGTGAYMAGSGERVAVAYSWVMQLLTQQTLDADLVMPSPIAANLFRMLSEGLFGFENARKVADTPFPFPWAQAVLLLLVLFAFTAPLLIAAYVERLWLAILLDVISVQSYFVLNEVARDLEDPFIFEPNDLPMAHLQYQFNERLKAASCTVLPFALKDCCEAVDANGADSRPASTSTAPSAGVHRFSNVKVELDIPGSQNPYRTTSFSIS